MAGFCPLVSGLSGDLCRRSRKAKVQAGLGFTQLFQQTIVVSVRANPEPDDFILLNYTNGTVIPADANRVYWTIGVHSLEL